jgi:uncharacterized lipoprotein
MSRRRIGIILALLGVSILAGCSTREPTVFTKPGVTTSQQKADEAKCTEAAIGVIQDPRLSPLPPVDREVFERCMRAKGYAPAQK